jgi:hypothetical protein
MVSAALMHHRQQKFLDEDDTNNCSKNGDDKAIELLCEYARWLAVFPVAVKHFLRTDRCNHLRLEIGTLLSDKEFAAVMKEYDDDNGEPTLKAVSGFRTRDAPLVVLNHLHRLAYDVTYVSFPDPPNASSLRALNSGQGALFEMISGQINQLYDAYGAMERIQLSPLPFIYAIHLRFFLLVYLFLWNMASVANYDWLVSRCFFCYALFILILETEYLCQSLPFLFLFNWSLLGIEACSVVCESPFHYNPNHLTLGRNAVVVARNIGQALTESRN